jgi:hypothetical protein
MKNSGFSLESSNQETIGLLLEEEISITSNNPKASQQLKSRLWSMSHELIVFNRGENTDAIISNICIRIRICKIRLSLLSSRICAIRLQYAFA